MDCLRDIDLLAGKTIKSAKIVELEEILSIVFTDDTCAFFTPTISYGDLKIEIEDSVGEHAMHEAGVISDEELAEIKKAKYIKISEERTQDDLIRLAQLKKQYEN